MVSPRVRAAWFFHRRIMALGHLPAAECAYGDCPMPGYPRHALAVAMEHGVQRWFFCSGAHRMAWLDEQEPG